MQQYLVPLVTTQFGNNTISAPKYLGTSASFSCIPFGQEGLGLVSAIANAALAQPDVFAFPALTGVVTPNDLDPTVPTSFAAFCAANNIPATPFVSGMSWQDVLIATAQIFLAAQAISGVTGAPIFTAGVTPNSPITASGAAVLVPTASQSNQKGSTNNKAGGTAAPAPVATSNGPYDFTQIDSSGTVGDALNLLGQQFVGVVDFGTIGAQS